MLYEKTQITGKGQIQLPAKIRQAIGANIGDELLFKLSVDGEISVELIKKRNLSDFAGSLPVKMKFPGIEEEEKITKEKVAEKVAEEVVNYNGKQ